MALPACEMTLGWKELNAAEPIVAPASDGAQSFTTVARGAYSSFEKSGVKAVKTKAAWFALKDEGLADGHQTLPPAASIDFDREMFIVAAMGQRRTGGYAIEITQVVENDDALTVYYQLRTPASGSFVTQALTSPYHIIRLPKSDLPLAPQRQQ